MEEGKWNSELWRKVPHETNRTELWAADPWFDPWRHRKIFMLFRRLFTKLSISCSKWYAQTHLCHVIFFHQACHFIPCLISLHPMAFYHFCYLLYPLFLPVLQLSQFFSQKSWKARWQKKEAVSHYSASFQNLLFLWSGGKDSLAFVLVPNMKLDRQDIWLC